MKEEVILAFIILNVALVTSSENSTTTPTVPTTSVPTTVQTTKDPTKTHVTITGTTTTPISPKQNCSAHDKCSDCTDASGCYWCGPSDKCLSWPKGKLIPRGCSGNKWFVKQCVVPGYVLIIVVPSLAGLILLCCGCCIYCKCCRQSNKSWKKEEERITQRAKDRQLRNDEKKAERKKRTDELRMKYGLLKSDDEEPLI